MARTGRPLAMSMEKRKALVFAAAENLFGERGYEKVTMVEIANAAGMSKRTLYTLFTDKIDLLRELIGSSYIWPEGAFETEGADPVDALGLRLRVMIDHVLSPRHIALCRLAISEYPTNQGLADEFMAMGIGRSREQLIQSIKNIPPERRVLDLQPAIIAGMLYGATCGLRLTSALLIGSKPNLREAYKVVNTIIAATFHASLNNAEPTAAKLSRRPAPRG
jgi:AcrR family transcriptional regulator